MRIYEILKKTSPEDVISKIKLHYGNKYIDLYKDLFFDLLNMNPTYNGQKLVYLLRHTFKTKMMILENLKYLTRMIQQLILM